MGPTGPIRYDPAEVPNERAPKTNRKGFGAAASIRLALIGLLTSAPPAVSQNTSDWITGLPREPIHVRAWPGEKKVAVCFVLYVEVWGFGHGPNFRPDTAARDPDVVDESFRQYAIDWGIPRVGRVFKEQGLPLSIALNALFPEQYPDVWKQFRGLVPQATIIAHGINNSTELLPLGRGLDAQRAYIRRTLDLIEKIPACDHGDGAALAFTPTPIHSRRRPAKASAIPSTPWIRMSSLASPLSRDRWS